MKKYIHSLLIILLALAACNTEDLTPDIPQTIKKEKINGYVQKGPFVSGTSILMNELNSDLVQTGKIFTSNIINDLGLFEVNNIELTSSFVEFTASGFYFDEVSGKISNSPLTLTAISDISNRPSINVNVLTHLEKRRVETLIKEGKSFVDAKTQSRNELLAVFSMSLNNNASLEEFDVSKNTEEGAVLLAVSIILQAKRSVGELTELLSRIQNDFSSNGKLDDDKILYALRISMIDLDYEEIRLQVERRFKDLNNNSEIPNFESQIQKFLMPKNLNITIQGQGSVEEKLISNPSGKEYPINSIVELTPIPDDGWTFDSWSGDLTGNKIPESVTLNEQKEIIAIFKRLEFPVNVTVEGEGTVEQRIIDDPNSRKYPFESVVELTAVPAEGWAFDGWSGEVVGRENPLILTIKNDINITVKFSKPIFKILDNGITCFCEGVNPGNKGIIDGVEYEAVDNELLKKRRDEGADLTKLCTSLVTNLDGFFEGRQFNGAIGNWDVSNVTSMQRTFKESSFNQPIGSWDVSNVTDISAMFMFSPFNQSLENWDVSSVNFMSRTFQGSKFNQPIGNWDVGNVRDMSWMFNESPFNQDIGAWDVGNVTNMNSMFWDSSFNQAIGSWDVSQVTDMVNLFHTTPFNQPIGNWNVSKVKNLQGLFINTPFNQSLENWDVSNVESIRYMFASCPFNQPLANWDVSKVKDMSGLFSGNSKFNQPIGNWNVSNVEEMIFMFQGANSFNQPLNDWDVSKVTTMAYMFIWSGFDQPIENWDVSNVVNMKNMFQGSSFNQPLNKWDVSNVTDMSYMFDGSSFNRPLDNWDVSNVENMRHMFSGSMFNQDIGSWNVSKVENMTWMFHNARFNQDISKWCVIKIPSEPFNFSTSSTLRNENKPIWGTCPD